MNIDMRTIARGCEERYPEEACGFILLDGSHVFLDNVADKPTEDFSISPLDYLKYHDRLGTIFHSHCRTEPWLGQGPTIIDQRQQHYTNVPWLVFIVESGRSVLSFAFSSKNDLDLDLPYIQGISDELEMVERTHPQLRKFWREGDWLGEDPEAIEKYFQERAIDGQLVHVDYRERDFKNGDILLGARHGDERNLAAVCGVVKRGRVHWRDPGPDGARLQCRIAEWPYKLKSQLRLSL